MPEHYETLPSDKEPVLRLVAMPTNTNAFGDIFGGWIMSQVDIAGSIAAHRRAGGRVVTVAVNAFKLHRPVFIGDLVSCYAEVTHVGRTSITVHVDVYAERDTDPACCLRVTEADVTYVAVDADRRPRPIDHQA